VHNRDVGEPGAMMWRSQGYTTTMAAPHVEYLAHHWIVLAVPAFLPAVIVVAVVLYIALRDRHAGQTDDSDEPAKAADEKGD
jgi:hypothetical protein